jgi:hypothetical protein
VVMGPGFRRDDMMKHRDLSRQMKVDPVIV